jgi:hypothetical protein
MRFKIGDSVVTARLIYVIGGSSMLRPGHSGTVLKVDGGLLVKFDGLPDAIGVFSADVVAR